MNQATPRHDSIIEALWTGDLGDAALHVARGSAVNHLIDGEGDTKVSFLEVLAGQDKYEAVEFLLKNGAQVDLANSRGQTALFAAIVNRDERMVTLLLTYGADPNTQENRLSQTALHAAAMEGDVPIIKVPLGFGARADEPAKSGITPLVLAAHAGHRAAAELLAAGNLHAALREQFKAAREALRGART